MFNIYKNTMITTLLKPLFVSKARIKILNLFFENINDAFFVREITRKTGEQINAVRRELGNLEDANIVYSYVKDGKKYFFLNSDYFFYDELFSLFKKASTPALQIAAKFKKIQQKVSFLLITGTLIGLKEENTPIDIFIVGNVSKEKISQFIKEEMGGKKEAEIRFAIVTEKEFLERIQTKDPILKKLLLIPQNIIPINTMHTKLDSL